MAPLSSLRGRLLLLVGLALLPLLGFLGLARERMNAYAQEEWGDNVLRIAETAASAHRETLERTRWVLEALARAPAVREPRAETCEELFGAFYDFTDYYTAFGIASPDGRTLCTLPDRDEPMDLSERPYFREALVGRTYALSDYHIGHLTGRSVVTMAVPVLGPDSSVVAILAAGIELSRLDPLPPDAPLPPGAHLTLVDRRGAILFHSTDSVEVGVPVPEVVQRLARNTMDDTVATIDVPGLGPRTYAVEHVRNEMGDVGADVLVSFDPAVVEGQIGALARSSYLGVGVAALLLVVGLWTAVEILVLRRIAPVVAAADRLGRGELDARSGMGSGEDEIARLGRAFDRMADNLQAARNAEAEWARRQVARSEKRLELLAETIDEVFWVWDPEAQRYEYLSPAFESIWGFPRRRLLDDPGTWLGSMHPDDRPRMEERLIDRGTLREGVHEYRIVRPDDEVRWIASRTFAVRGDDGRVERYLGVAQDITERKGLEDALLQASKLEAVGRLAGGVAHDFNNVLTAIQGHTQFMEEVLPPDHPARADLVEISTGVKRAAGLTRQLLTFSRKQAVRPEVLDVNQVVADTVSMLERLIGEDVTLVLETAADVPPIEADVHQIEQVLVNLSVNARDAMPDGGTLTIGTARATVVEAEAGTSDVLLPGEYAEIWIRDTGHGIPGEIMEHLFEPFFTTKPVGQGTGLGLATVYGIVKQCGGAVRVESEGVGAAFHVYLPATRATVAVAPAEAAISGGGGTRARRVLLVEDEEAVRSVTERILRSLGCEVWSAASGREALTTDIPAGGVDILLTDVIMPGMNGIELHRRLLEAGGDLAVVFMSGYPGFGPDEGSPADGHVFLQKPFTTEEVAAALEEALGRGRG